MVKLITYGSFDLFHYGHLCLLKRVKEFGDYLIVAISTDEFNKKKNKESIIYFSQRSEIVRSIRYVDEVIREECWEQKEKDIRNNKIDILVMGSDWKGKFDYLSKYCQVIYLDRTPNISTTEIKNRIAKKNHY